MTNRIPRRRFLQSIPLGAAVAQGVLPAQHPGFAPAAAESPAATATCRYSVEDGAITIRNGTYFNNRPLYCAHRAAAVLGGDRPLLRFIQDNQVCGVLSIAIVKDGAARWLHEAADVRMEYRCGHLTWHIADPAFPGAAFTLEAVPFDDRAGFAVRLRSTGVPPGTRLLWSFGAAHEEPNVMWAFDPVLMAQDEGWREPLSKVLFRGLEPERARGNSVAIDGRVIRVARAGAKIVTFAGDGGVSNLSIGDAAQYADPSRLLSSGGGDAPVGLGVHALKPETHWVVESAPAGGAVDQSRTGQPAASFDRALATARALAGRVVVKTPEPRLDASVTSALHAIDSIFYPPVHRHGCMAWNVRLPGWRTQYGATVFGWIDRVVEQAKFYLSSQVKESKFTTAEPEPATRLCEQSSRSRLNGVGRIPRDSGHYDFQSQLIDQLIHAWRWTGSPELARLLRETLPLHAVWMQECFDPDDDGLYESYINTWPTDSVWYNGGGSVEESCYAYTTHRALADLDPANAPQHRARMDKIARALARVLWIGDRGHYGAYIEQGGHHRVHSDSWLYSQFLPIDAGIAGYEESLQALYYCEWALENVRPPYGGRRVWISNWVPSKWSVRELYHGDNYHLALACFQSGLADDGWEILKGNLLDSGYARVVPGSQSSAGAGTDFGDILNPFCRAVVEGLFGYAPDLPNNVVHLRPAFPTAWPTASISTPDFSLRYWREGDADLYELTLARAARVECRIPVRAEAVRAVTANGAPVQWTPEPGVGHTVLLVTAPEGKRLALRVDLDRRVEAVAPPTIEGAVGAPVQLTVPRGEIEQVRDLQGALTEVTRGKSTLRARLAARPGHHLVLARTLIGQLPQWTMFRVLITDREGDARRAARTPVIAPANAKWQPLDLSRVHNGDIRAIFRQQYLSPRPATVSVRIGVDGYSPWTFAPWKLAVPEIDLSRTSGQVVTPQGARFSPIDPARNIAFTSLWDNWPSSIALPVNQRAKAMWMLVAGSTNPMQTQIANAVLRFRYADGVEETLELVPPLNFWSLCPLGGRDYSYSRDGFSLPKAAPPTVQLGNNCRAMVLSWVLRDEPLSSLTLEALSQEVVIGLMAASLIV